MGMNEPNRPRSGPSPTLDDLAVYALDAHEPEEAQAIAAYLEEAPGAAGWERTLREAAGEYGAAATPESDPPGDLRERVLGAAGAGRVPSPVVAGASPIDVHRTELSRMVLLLSDLTPDEWARPLDPPEFAGWTVHELAAHIAANESLLADHLGVPVEGVTETEQDNEGRTAAAQARHRDLPPAAAVGELEAAAEAVDTEVQARGEARLDERVEWWDGPTAIRVALLVRAFETWTHADDVRRATGRPMVAPPEQSLRTMSSAACGFVPSFLAAREVQHPGRVVRLRFEDLGPDAAWDIDLGTIGGVRPASGTEVDTEIAMSGLAFCRAVSNRPPGGTHEYEATGDTGLAAAVVDSLAALAFL
jgi:uncharacterized protein (TIGR03083 family)